MTKPPMTKAMLNAVLTGKAVPFGRPDTLSAIGKHPADAAVAIGPAGLEGDEQADRRNHGGPDKAVHHYPFDHYAAWLADLPAPALLLDAVGAFGENLTLEGVDCTESVIGDRLRVGPLLLEVSQPRIPCATLAKHLGDPLMVKRFAQARRPGIYLRIIEPGDVGAGDTVELVERPEHGVTVALVNDAVLHDHGLAARALEAPQLAESIASELRQRVAT